MKKLSLFFVIGMICSLSAFAATYKINSQGAITSPNGKTQNKPPIFIPAPAQTTNYYNNYSSGVYTGNKQVLAAPVSTIDIVMDFSGSMDKWINAAKNSMNIIVGQLPPSTKIGLRTFGERTSVNTKEPVAAIIGKITKNGKGYSVSSSFPSYLKDLSGYCSASRQAYKINYKNPVALTDGINSSIQGGSTPLTLGLHQAVYIDFAGLGTVEKKKIVLITDGGENCGGDPCAFVEDLMSKRNDIIIDVVLVSANSRALMCLTKKTGGRFYSAGDVNGFVNSLTESVSAPPMTQIQTPSQNYEYVED